MSDTPQVTKQPNNPWMIGLTVLWVLLAAIAVCLLIAGATADDMSYDQPGMPPSSVLAGIYYACSGVTAAVAVIVIGVQLGVGALRWHLDPSSRYVPPVAAERVRQDF